MPISDSYIVQYLLDGTVDLPPSIRWREKCAEQIGYRSLVEGVEVILEPVYSAGRFAYDLEVPPERRRVPH